MEREGVTAGSMDSPLTPNGVQQAILCGAIAQPEIRRLLHLAIITRAPHRRLVLEQLDNPHELTEADALRERCFGEWEGMLWDDIEEIPGAARAGARRWRLQDTWRRRVSARDAGAHNFLEKLATSGYTSVLCVTHSATANALVKEVLGLPQSARGRLPSAI